MAGTDIVFFYTDPNTGEDYYGVRDLYNAWVAAGRPPINSAGRLYGVQKSAWDAYQGGWGSPADNPDQPQNYELGHCRFAALDITPTPQRVRALEAAGLVRPFSYESWHWRLPSLYNYPIVYSIPSSASDGSIAFLTTPELPKEDDMAYPIKVNGVHYFLLSPGSVAHLNASKVTNELTRNLVAANDAWVELDGDQFAYQLSAFGIPGHVVDIQWGQVLDVTTGQFAKGAAWSWGRDASAKADKTAAAIADLKASLPKE